ncbi:Predicted DNA-binding transcriptional regulator YafY, contains an HTH and WYL domains [Streptosporangium subroseum]|uniref:Predicted DNA-binding transcriptional regulator YafY, contains an HTH and WYL domains n=1 Tax=Streptosporangium subroseum TaxID=106412 RepID=A0A239LWD6_9ACTN|nr:YafY family protein [Streptosporangium subroseum]SNT33934.1 Predicted DNA-binding transcriptional regulator YafY, contains an HTH and WYL domains [Streptosporangium subroseum]
MLETSARLLRLLSLLQTPRDWTGADLAQRLEVDVRTVRRDVDKLRTLGYPVHATPGVAGYRLGAGAKLPPLLLDDDEAIAVAIGLGIAATGTVAGIEEASVRALTKLEQVLPSRLRHRVTLLHSVTVTVPAAGPTVEPEVLTAVAVACRDHQRLRFDYRGHDGRASVRTTEPHRLVHTGRRWYLIAWDLERAGWRTYRMDRLAPRIPTGPRFTPREAPDIDLAAYLSRGVSTAAYRYRAHITVHVAAEAAAERIPPTVGVIESVDLHSCLLHTGSNSLDELALYLGLFNLPLTVHEPPELIAHIRDLATRLADAVR